MAKNTPKTYAAALLKSIEGLSEKDLNAILKRFVEVLKNDHKLKQAPKIIKLFTELYKKQKGIKEITIKSAHTLEESTIEEIKKVFGKNVEATTEIEKEILGGVKIKSGDHILDASLKTQLNKLKQKLI